MNIWTIVAVVAALIFGGCVGYIISQIQSKKYIDKLLWNCKETSDKLTKLSNEYEDFVKAAHEVDHWPKHNSHIIMKENLADYLKNKYFGSEEIDPDCDDETEEDEELEDLYL